MLIYNIHINHMVINSAFSEQISKKPVGSIMLRHCYSEIHRVIHRNCGKDNFSMTGKGVIVQSREISIINHTNLRGEFLSEALYCKRATTSLL